MRHPVYCIVCMVMVYKEIIMLSSPNISINKFIIAYNSICSDKEVK